MKIAAVICEYNPFHAGHARLFESLRRAEGEDTAIVAIMSGNYTQRGTPAILDKRARAAMAVEGGADLVLELSFPYSTAGAERFARAGVAIAEALGCVELLFFGSECGDTAALTQLASRLESRAFRAAFAATGERSSLGCAEKTGAVYEALFGADAGAGLLAEPNNLLGVEYIRALLRTDSSIRPLALPRVGMPHDAREGVSEEITSAGYFRRIFAGTGDGTAREAALSRLPSYTATIFRNEISARKSVADEKKFNELLFLYYRTAELDKLARADGMRGGLAARILRAAWQTADADSFFSALRTKKYTDAYLRRALIYGYFGVTREELNAPPLYTQILAMSPVGQRVLARARKTASIPLLTKPADYRSLPDGARGQAARSARADAVYAALFDAPLAPADIFRYHPYRKECRSTATS